MGSSQSPKRILMIVALINLIVQKPSRVSPFQFFISPLFQNIRLYVYSHMDSPSSQTVIMAGTFSSMDSLSEKALSFISITSTPITLTGYVVVIFFPT